ncbi:hypothetical protein [Acinetobacter pollinis]|uniref:hypothetical protein n=1 Tax=Acinetobacter pollinis TaxID=2605270 RepID=UPI0018A25BA3|nr:hypothetical protein [Acinetobacter pollinis]MBF7690782.1 hypothetical protein [Acinetobacter pollinis]MBF7693695.1 hypothetical protein [Acinetobacter pollinis]MBF7698386.1 hypothetical protein [Acinetobacter pollinis]MBF7701305.1 hypothetical protein [Acinetobacter pollinis]
MNKEDLLVQISQEFKNVTLGDAYTLVEEDYYDTAHCHFDEACPLYFMSQEEWDKEEIEGMTRHSWWLPEEIEEAIKAIKEKRKISNRFPNPLDIPYKYLEAYGMGFFFLKPQAYLFYTPSMMIHILCNSEGVYHGLGFGRWLGVLQFGKEDELNSLLSHFSKKQFNLLINFLEHLINLDTIDEFDKEDTQIVLNKIQPFKSK